MTLARLEAEMSSNELEIWMAKAMVESDECPQCHHEPVDMNTGVKTQEVKCPICGHKYWKLRYPGVENLLSDRLE